MIGTMSQMLAGIVLESIPDDISIVDDRNRVVAWNHHDSRIFKRPLGVVGRDVRDCHPPKSLHLVERLLDEMRRGERDSARFWIDMTVEGEPRKILIEYFALRDEAGAYRGCMECSRDISDLQKLTGQKRLPD